MANLTGLSAKPHGTPVKPIKPGAKFNNGKKISLSHFSTSDVVNKYGPSGQKPQPVPRGIRRYFICSSRHHL